MIHCTKLKKTAAALNAPPFPGALGEKIYQRICAEAWQQWLSHQTMLINEYRLRVIDPQAKKFLLEEMEKFLFGEGSEKPAGYIAKEEIKNDENK